MTRRWLIDLPTRIHLWSAEFQIRHRSSADPERLRNLDVLREYRKSRAFPRNDTALRSTPYFVDTDGRHCAVGHLMRESGEHAAVRRIAAEANLARIDDMDPADLVWAGRSGLTKRELARIQPEYASTEQSAFNLLVWAALVLVPFALLSVALGRIRLERVALRARLAIAPVALCTVLSFLAYTLVDLSGVDKEDHLPLVVVAWIAAIVGPTVAAVVMVGLVRRERVRTEVVAPVTGVTAGGLMTILMVIYLLAGAVDQFTYEPAGLWDDGSRFFFPIGFGVLLIGLLALVWAVRALRWRVRV
ncbi:hypothetical protein [Kribbella soli]|uniref:Uncharacterized protein n=1 Tax=Kribbella soli TaxID=1124743 RepID=A0A4R0HH90_9ACTN|nr:hypothetical protein [Kribbella soli]TCC09793.1 hypothetical protein E0H45_00110 [Kribbella soli]